MGDRVNVDTMCPDLFFNKLGRNAFKTQKCDSVLVPNVLRRWSRLTTAKYFTEQLTVGHPLGSGSWAVSLEQRLHCWPGWSVRQSLRWPSSKQLRLLPISTHRIYSRRCCLQIRELSFELKLAKVNPQFSVMIGFMSSTTTVTLRTANVLARSSPMPDAPPVMMTICSLHSRGGGRKIRLPWFLYSLEYHCMNPRVFRQPSEQK